MNKRSLTILEANNGYIVTVNEPGNALSVDPLDGGVFIFTSWRAMQEWTEGFFEVKIEVKK